MNQSAIQVTGLSKRFQIGKNIHGTLRHTLHSLLSRQEKEVFWALKDVSFEIQKGEAVGIVGINGAGKSTLLKILSKISQPTQGRIEINGRLTSLLEIGTGFHPELTGRENIYLNGSLLGMERQEIKAKFDEIVDFSGVAQFIDTPVKHFSSGMYTRLAFSVSAHLNTEILVVDEVLAVGDAAFQKKCLGKMSSLTETGKTVLLVSHNYSYLEKICRRFIKLEKGRIAYDGNELTSIEDISVNRQSEIDSKNKVITNLIIKPMDGENLVQSGKDLIIHIESIPFEAMNHQILRLEIIDSFGGVKLIINNRLIDHICDLRKGGSTTITIKNLPLNQGVYGINLVLKDRIKEIDALRTPHYFNVHPNSKVKLTNARSQAFSNYEYSEQR
jgi:ABC-type polysaccharide/polyol phosphate transport system ATPase subunit